MPRRHAGIQITDYKTLPFSRTINTREWQNALYNVAFAQNYQYRVRSVNISIPVIETTLLSKPITILLYPSYWVGQEKLDLCPFRSETSRQCILVSCLLNHCPMTRDEFVPDTCDWEKNTFETDDCYIHPIESNRKTRLAIQFARNLRGNIHPSGLLIGPLPSDVRNLLNLYWSMRLHIGEKRSSVSYITLPNRGREVWMRASLFKLWNLLLEIAISQALDFATDETMTA